MDGASGTAPQIAAAILLFAMMTVVGLELRGDDFRRVARRPKAVLWGTAGQLLLLPALTFALLDWMEPPPLIAAGAVLILAAPGGGISNVFTLLAGANPALSVTLTGVASLLSAVTLPLVSSIGFEHVLGESAAIRVPLVPMTGQLVALVGLPIGLGMWLRVRWPEVAIAFGPMLRHAVLGAVVVLVGIGIASDSSGLAADAVRGLGTALAWTALAAVTGYAVGRTVGLPLDDRVTLAIEYSTKNVGLAAIVALAALERPELAVFSAAYVATAYPLVAVAAVVFRRVREARAAASG